MKLSSIQLEPELHGSPCSEQFGVPGGKEVGRGGVDAHYQLDFVGWKRGATAEEEQISVAQARVFHPLVHCPHFSEPFPAIQNGIRIYYTETYSIVVCWLVNLLHRKIFTSYMLTSKFTEKGMYLLNAK